MSIKVQISAGDRHVTVETTGSTVDLVVAKALTAWKATRPARGQAAGPPTAEAVPPKLEAGGFGFQAERADGPTYGDDCPGTARSA